MSRELPMHALDVQLDLLRYYESTPGMVYAGGVARAMFLDATFGAPRGDGFTDITGRYESNDQWIGLDGSLRGEDKMNETEKRVVDRFGIALHRIITGMGEVYAVESEIVDVLEVAAPSMPTFTLHQSDLPSRIGFVYLGRPILVHDDKGKSLVVKAFGWHVAIKEIKSDDTMLPGGAPVSVEVREPKSELDVYGNGIVMLLWTDPLDERDHMHEEMLRDREALRRSYASPPENLYSMLGGAWLWNEEPHGAVGKFVLALFRFMQETWVDSRMIDPSRAVKRRAIRAKKPVPAVRVVELRRSAHVRRPGEGDGDPIEWSHRWLVRGHWRNQWYPSLQDHRPKWIPEYIKGPDDKPLVIHDKVYHVDR